MRKKDWVEFNNEPFLNEDNQSIANNEKFNKVEVYKKKKSKNGKMVTIISGINLKDKFEAKSFLKRLKIFLGTGGKYDGNDFQLQGDLVDKVKDFLHKENFQI
tara:strand:- start:1258 stop:1566 length:309 start_codon:yes stop_codon:yes gene_type:complete